MSEPKVMIVDDELDVRDALALLLKSVGYIVQTFPSAQNYWDKFDPEQAGCIVLDVRMPGMSGLDLQRQLARLIYHPPIIMVSGHGEISMAVEAIKSGAIDFLQKPFSDQLLIDKVKQALEQDRAGRIGVCELREVRTAFAKLTPREREVLNGVIIGKLNKIIAAELNVSMRTVEIHRSNMMEKMQVNSIAALMRRIALLEDNRTVSEV